MQEQNVFKDTYKPVLIKLVNSKIKRKSYVLPEKKNFASRIYLLPFEDTIWNCHSNEGKINKFLAMQTRKNYFLGESFKKIPEE